MINDYDVFVCHSSEDKESCAREFALILERNDVKVWYDEAEIKLGDSIIDKIQKGLTRSRFVCLIVTENFLRKVNSYGRNEANFAIDKQIGSGITLVHSLLVGIDDSKFKHNFPFLAARRFQKLKDTNELIKYAESYAKQINDVKQTNLVTRSVLQNKFAPPERRIEDANEEILISGNDCKYISSITQTITIALDRGVAVKLLCVKPGSSAAEMLPMIDPRFSSVEYFNSEVESVIASLKGLYGKEKYRGLFEMRAIEILPSIGFFITDRMSESGFTKIELYCSKPFEPLGERLHIVFHKDDHVMRRYFYQQWENYWKLGENNILVNGSD